MKKRESSGSQRTTNGEGRCRSKNDLRFNVGELEALHGSVHASDKKQAVDCIVLDDFTVHDFAKIHQFEVLFGETVLQAVVLSL